MDKGLTAKRDTNNPRRTKEKTGFPVIAMGFIVLVASAFVMALSVVAVALRIAFG